MASILRPQQTTDVNALADSVESLKISTLVNAAKISPLVQERTIGPDRLNNENKNSSKIVNASRQENQSDYSSTTTDDSSTNGSNHRISDTSKSSNEPTTPRFRRDVWREVNIDSESVSPRNILNINDCKAISFRLAAKDAEKERRSKIFSNLQVKQDQWETELEERLQKIRIETAEEQQRKQAKRLERERQMLKAIEEIEAQAKQDELHSNQRKMEMIEHSRKLIEKANQLKKQNELRLLVESINANKTLFINLFELYAKTIIGAQTILNQHDKLTAYINKRDELLKCYEHIMNLVNARTISQAETEMFEQLCDDIKQEQNNLSTELEQLNEQAENRAISNTAAAAAAAAIVPPQSNSEQQIPANRTVANQPTNVQEVSVTDGNPTIVSSLTVAKSVGNEERIAYYSELMKFYENYRNEIEPIVNDVNLKKFRFNCQKCVNTPVNSIAAVSALHLQDKLEKISLLLSGNQVIIGDFCFNAAEHPIGIKYCTFLLAKKFITQGTTVTSSHPQAAFPIAAVLVALWQHYPDLGNLFLATLYIECPFFVPYFPPHRQGQNDDEYFSLLGYKFTDGKMEDQDQYLKRIAGLQRLYSAILITKSKRNQAHQPHPHGLENGWIWLSNFLMLDPLPGISPTLMVEFFQICGADMSQAYRGQFMKLIAILYAQYMPRLDQIDTGGPHSRLKDLILSINEGQISPPTGTISPNFW